MRNKIPENFGLHWFRRDLRIAGNPALSKNFSKNNGNILGIFCFDAKFLSREDFSPNRFQFFLETLSELKKEMLSAGGDLLVLDIGPEKAFEALLTELARVNLKPNLVTWNRDYEPFAQLRDATMSKYFSKEKGIEVVTENDHLLIEPDEILKEDGSRVTYQIYSPFKRRWLEAFKKETVQARIARQKKGICYLEKSIKVSEKLFKLTWSEIFNGKSPFTDKLGEYLDKNRVKVNIEIPRCGSVVALNHLDKFKSKISNYGTDRDIPGLSGTSQASIFLKNGSLTIAQIIARLNLKTPTKGDGKDKYLSELIWREFYYHILYHFPYVENESFQPKFKNLKWENNLEYFEAWKRGMTGYPIVDAGMRQLKATGWMHNRVRMIVASFLTKDLLVDYKWGELYFMNQLLDGDLAPNNGGWQWAASTGCDPQPYFRIFNPTLQSLKFDPDCVYIKRYVPELVNVENKFIHEPLKNPETVAGYPRPIVDHKLQKEKALKMYKS